MGPSASPWGPQSDSLGAMSRGLHQVPFWQCEPVKKQPVIFVVEQGPQVLRVFWRRPQLMKVWEPVAYTIVKLAEKNLSANAYPIMKHSYSKLYEEAKKE